MLDSDKRCSSAPSSPLMLKFISFSSVSGEANSSPSRPGMLVSRLYLSLGFAGVGQLLGLRLSFCASTPPIVASRWRPNWIFISGTFAKRVSSGGTVALRQYLSFPTHSCHENHVKRIGMWCADVSPTLDLKIRPCLLHVALICNLIAPIHLLELVAEEVLFFFEHTGFGTQAFWISL